MSTNQQQPAKKSFIPNIPVNLSPSFGGLSSESRSKSSFSTSGETSRKPQLASPTIEELKKRIYGNSGGGFAPQQMHVAQQQSTYDLHQTTPVFLQPSHSTARPAPAIDTKSRPPLEQRLRDLGIEQTIAVSSSSAGSDHLKTSTKVTKSGSGSAVRSSRWSLRQEPTYSVDIPPLGGMATAPMHARKPLRDLLSPPPPPERRPPSC